ncbi:hypothetical protein GEMRC1_003999 [Eukaryota sp. GEM-RC1]
MLETLYPTLYLCLDKYTMICVLNALTFGLLLFETLRYFFPTFNLIFLRSLSSTRRRSEKYKSTGFFYYTLSSLVITFLFSKQAAVVGQLVAVYGDLAAALVGSSVRSPLIRIDGKSVEGFLACVVVSTAVALSLMLYVVSVEVENVFYLSVIIGVSSSLVELLGSTLIDDNFLMPVVCSFVTDWLLFK